MSAFSQPINPAATETAIVELDSRTNYLRDQLDRTAALKSLIRYNVPMAPDVAPGNAVYWNQTNSRYEKSKASVMVDLVTDNLVTTNEAQCVGLCSAKSAAAVGDVAISGYITGTSAILLNMTGSSTPTPGLYYLSADTAGLTTRTRSTIPIHVAYIQSPSVVCGIDYEILIVPGVEDLVSDHIHLQFELAAVPAGTHIPPASTGNHTISPSNTAIQGWLPASDPVFGGTAPAGAMFGYNMSQHLAFQRQWPPVPEEAFSLEFTDYETLPARVGGMRRVDPSYYQITEDGLWWMTDCYGQVPWDRTLDTTAVVVPPVGSCVDSVPPRLFASFSRSVFMTRDQAVLRLKGDVNNILTFKNQDGVVSQTGYLQAVLTPESAVQSQAALGSLAFKEIVPGTFKFSAGRVTEGLILSSSELTASSTHSRLLDPSQVASVTNPVVHQGIISLAYNGTGAVIDLNPAIVWLGDTLQRELGNVRYIAFPAGRDSKLTVRFDIPYDSVTGPFTLMPRVQLFGRGPIGPIPAMTASLTLLPKANTALPVSLTQTPVSLTFDTTTPTTGRPADILCAVSTSAFAVSPGDTVFVTFSRTGTVSPAYTYDVGFLRVSGLLVKAANWTSFPT